MAVRTANATLRRLVAFLEPTSCAQAVREPAIHPSRRASEGSRPVTPWRTLLWSFGRGESRVSCGVTRTDDGYVVDVLRGDVCIDKAVHATREKAVRQALALENAHRVRAEDAGEVTEPRRRRGPGIERRTRASPRQR
jgi:hypothetical protein